MLYSLSYFFWGICLLIGERDKEMVCVFKIYLEEFLCFWNNFMKI